jgi:arabinose-5-phosphate isomerase
MEKELEIANKLIENTINHLNEFKDSLISENNLTKVINLILSRQGKIIISGIGKSGHIGRKIASTLSSTGTLSVFIDSNEASHGDIGLIEKEDIIILISNSGNAKEMESIIHYSKNLNIPIIAITKNKYSLIAKNSEISLIYNIVNEGINSVPLAPIVSTEIVLLIGHIIAACLVERKQFSEMKYKIFHPGGEIGKKLNNKE